MSAFLQSMINGVVIGSVYGLVAVGFVLLYKATQVVNFAQGFLLVVGAYLGVTFMVVHSASYAIGVVLVTIVGAVLGWALFQVLMRRFVGSPLFTTVMVTIGVGLVAESITAIAYGNGARAFPAPIPQGVVRFGNLSITWPEIIVISVVAMIIVALTVFFRATHLGLEMRAVATDLEAAASQGVDVAKVFAIAWALAIALALASGVFMATLTPVVSVSFAALGLRAFPAAVIGGLDSIPGAMVGGLLIGCIEAVGVYYWGSETRDVLVFSILLAVIMIRPSGLLGSPALEACMTAVDFTAPVLPGDATDSRTSQTSRWWWLAIAAVAVFVPYNASSYQLTLVNTALLASVGALGTQIIAGYAHLISLGHAAFIASAAIISSCVATLWGWPTWIAIPASALGGGLLGLLVGLPALRVRGLYLLISTMALTFIAVFAYSKYEVRYFFGTSAVRVPDLSFFGFTIDTRMRWYWLLLFVCILATMFSLGLLRSRHGRSMLAIRENEMAASSLGVNVARVKLLAFFISSVMIGLMGSLLAFYLGGTSHESLTLDLAISYYVMIVIGGMGANVIGPLIGAFFVTLVPEVISWSSDWLDSVPVFGDSLVANQYPLRTLIYGLIIILVLAVQPGGFVAMGHSIRAWRARTRRGRMSVAIRPEGSLTVSNLSVAYGKSAPVLDDVTLEVRPGEIVALLGANGAGKTTLLRAMSGLLKLHAGRVVAGTIDVNGRSVLGLSSSRIARLGAGQVPEGRRIFATLTVEDNLRVTDRSRRGAGTGSSETLAQIYEMFPVLSERRKGIAGLLSGGEQQMLALGRALMGQPSLLCIDELSLGLAPLTTKKAMDQIVSLNAEHGLSVLLIEQNARLALKHAHRAYVLDVGRIAMAGDAAELLDTPELVRTYLGEAGS